MATTIDKVVNVTNTDVLNKDPAVTAKVQELAALLNKKGEALQIQAGTKVKSFFGLASSCCN